MNIIEKFDSYDKARYEELMKELRKKNRNISEKTVLRIVESMMKEYNDNFFDCLETYVNEYDVNEINSIYEVFYNGRKYASKAALCNEIFGKENGRRMSIYISQKMSKDKVSLEEALSLAKKLQSKNEMLIYKGKKYSTKKELLAKAFPNRDYISVSNSVAIIQKKNNCSFEEAIEIVKNNAYEQGDKIIRREIVYNGVSYKSLRSACRDLNIEPMTVCYYAKKYDNDYVRAIDKVIESKKASNRNDD